MTVEMNTPIKRYNYTGPADYSFNFTIYKDTDIIVRYIDNTGNNHILTKDIDYTITINTNNPGGIVHLTFDNTPQSGTLEIRRKLPITQTTDYVNNSSFDMNILENDLDKITMILQEMETELKETITPLTARQDWETNIQYVVGDVIVAPNDSLYQCVIDHTSTIFDDDLHNGYWIVLFDVSDLQQYASDAEQSANAAEQSANNASTYEQQAEQHKNDANTYAGQAYTYSNDARTYKDQSLQGAQDADQARQAAEAYANESMDYADDASNSATEAQQYATGNPVGGSAKHWAEQSLMACNGLDANLLINGNFDVWQRASVQNQDNASMSSADRWLFDRAHGGGSVTYTADRISMRNQYQVTPPTAKNNMLRYEYDGTSGGADSYLRFSQRIHGLRQFNFKRIWISFWATSAYGDVPLTISFKFKYGLYNEQNCPNTQKLTISNGWNFYRTAIDLPQMDQDIVDVFDCGELMFWTSAGSNFNSYLHNLGRNSGRIYFSGIGLTIGTEPRGIILRSQHEEELLCKKYYFKWDYGDRFNIVQYHSRYANTGNITYPVPMIRLPSMTMIGTPDILGNFSHALSYYTSYIHQDNCNLIFRCTSDNTVGSCGYVAYPGIYVEAEI